MILCCSATYLLKVLVRFSVNVATKTSFRDKTEECDQNFWNIFDQFGITIACSATNFLDVCARVLLKVATKVFVEVKKFWKFRFLGPLSKAKTEECDQKVWNVFDQFGITIPGAATFFLEVGAPVSLVKLSVLDYFYKANTEECDHKDWSVSDTFGIICSYRAT